MAPTDFVSGEQEPGEAATELHRELKPRQVFMFSIACAIGTGLIVGSGTALATGGPGSLLIAYIIVGVAVFSVMTALGEMAAFLPMKKGFGGYATRMVDPAFGYATGWNYWFKYITVAPANLTASGLILQYWRPDLNVGIWVAVFAVTVASINCLKVRYVGEIEFWASSIKVLVIVVVILTCFIISVGGNPEHHVTGFWYWHTPGAFAEYLLKGAKGRFLGWWACVCQACFSYIGTEVVGMTFGETPNPRKNVPRAVRQTFWRIACFYILAVIVVGMAVPYNSTQLITANSKSTSAAASPFVLAISLAGIKVFPDIINACLLVFTLSAASSDVYCASRSLYGLSRDGQAPKIFSKTLANGNPIYAVAFTSIFMAMGFLDVTKSSTTVFGYFVSLVTPFGVLNWMAILISHLRFRRALTAQGVSLSILPYSSVIQPYGSYYALVLSILVLIFNGYTAFIPHFTVSTFILKYLGVALFFLNYILWKFLKRTKAVSASEMDLVTGRQEFDGYENEEAADHKLSIWERVIG
ncbi:amino acid permease/ SLC12A domain-containing protein [Xylariales sp. PMI_506]|nr:amino acid permease/ SLC12A domain-containing protein [Xylariales sp. PMI_506]